MTSRLPRAVLTAAAMTALLLTAGCTGGKDATTQQSPAATEERPAVDRGAPMDDAAGNAAAGGREGELGAEAPARSAQEPARQALIKKGTVSLESDDVAAVRFGVQKVVDRHDGSISSQETTTGEDGELETARLVLRVPAAHFDRVTAELEGLATLTGSTSDTDDVTTQVIDNRVRIRAQRASLERIEALLARATDLGEVVSIERELTRRQAELDSLTQQQAWLADQTSLSTITVHVERPDAEARADDDGTGFLDGLEKGWEGLVGGLGVSLAVLGFLLPFLALAALLGLPLWRVLRRRRSRTGPAPQAP